MLVGALASSIAVLAGCGASPSPAGAEGLTGDPLVIGVIEDTSGAASFYSQQGVRMIEYAAEQVNRGEYPAEIAALFGTNSRGVAGRPIQLVTEDDGNDPNRAVQAARKLVGAGAKAIITTSSSASTIQARVVCQEEEIPCIASANASADIVKNPNADFVFTISPNSTLIAAVYSSFFKAKGYRTVAFVADSTPSSKAVTDAYRAALEGAGMTVVAQEVIPVGSTDATAQVSRVAAAAPAVVFTTCSSAPEEGLFYKYAGDRLATTPKWGTNNLTLADETVEIAGPAINGAKAADLRSPDNKYSTEVAEGFARAQGGDSHLAWTSLTHWDAVMLLKRAFESAGTDEGPRVVQEIEGIRDFPVAHGQPGYTVSFSAENHNGASARAIVPVVFENEHTVVAKDEQMPQ
ncbi:ABC transporter substrate-binding protein [Pseudonocardia kujensis]|uniref:ABC transporter substrate-binding protein n=1 Tax=Pseudonocardia kujensis TaxID=1128675 RepID=UPI001E35A4BB|nr:ABC transporter substrate-binding protein [Pseudonocardia kujensis]MCE0765077.1 ABC transporter substrate-binding protein [Pseudonocardia kujensis]